MLLRLRQQVLRQRELLSGGRWLLLTWVLRATVAKGDVGLTRHAAELQRLSLLAIGCYLLAEQVSWKRLLLLLSYLLRWLSAQRKLLRLTWKAWSCSVAGHWLLLLHQAYSRLLLSRLEWVWSTHSASLLWLRLAVCCC